MGGTQDDSSRQLCLKSPLWLGPNCLPSVFLACHSPAGTPPPSVPLLYPANASFNQPCAQLIPSWCLTLKGPKPCPSKSTASRHRCLCSLRLCHLWRSRESSQATTWRTTDGVIKDRFTAPSHMSQGTWLCSVKS